MALATLIVLAASVVVYLLDINWWEQVERWGFLGVFFLMLLGSMTIFLPLPFEAMLAATPGIMGLGWGGVFWLGLLASIGGSV